jgi:DnaJ family protein C protein 22
LSREFHPDKVKDESLRRAAQEKFMEIQQAYEVLSKMKSKRRSRNKKYTEEELAQQRAEQERAREDL